MSITFQPEYRDSDVVGHYLSCCSGARSETFASRCEAEAARADLPTFPTGEAYMADCRWFVQDGYCGAVRVEPEFGDPAPERNMSCANARFVLGVLGLVDDTGQAPDCGLVAAADLVARILLARALASDVGAPMTETRGCGGMLLIDGGRRAGYLAEALDDLDEIAQWAADRHRDIVWA